MIQQILSAVEDMKCLAVFMSVRRMKTTGLFFFPQIYILVVKMPGTSDRKMKNEWLRTVSVVPHSHMRSVSPVWISDGGQCPPPRPPQTYWDSSFK